MASALPVELLSKPLQGSAGPGLGKFIFLPILDAADTVCHCWPLTRWERLRFSLVLGRVWARQGQLGASLFNGLGGAMLFTHREQSLLDAIWGGSRGPQISERLSMPESLLTQQMSRDILRTGFHCATSALPF